MGFVSDGDSDKCDVNEKILWQIISWQIHQEVTTLAMMLAQFFSKWFISNIFTDKWDSIESEEKRLILQLAINHINVYQKRIRVSI